MAVERNRARRILRAAWRQVASTVEEGHDVVLVARQGIRGAKMQDLNSDIHASEEYRRAMIPVFTERALAAALSRAS